MTFVDAFILAVVEGLTEFIPVSSTGHLLVASKILNLEWSAFLSSFIITIQLGAILAIVCLYARRLILQPTIIYKVIAAFIPTAVIGFLGYSLFKQFLTDGLLIVGWSLFIGGVVILLFEAWYEERGTDTKQVEDISFKQAVILGACQALAMIPGVSRSGATIISGMSLRLSRQTIMEFSFLLAIPTMMSATAYDLLKSGEGFSVGEWEVLLFGFIASFVVSIVSVKWFLNFVGRHSFSWFGWYRIVVGLIILWFVV